MNLRHLVPRSKRWSTELKLEGKTSQTTSRWTGRESQMTFKISVLGKGEKLGLRTQRQKRMRVER